MSADTKQEGGDHYKGDEAELQHWNVVARMKWDYFIGNATKYLWRLGKKGDEAKAIEDIGKAIHYLEKKRELMISKLEMKKGTEKAIRVMKKVGIEFLSDTPYGEPGPGYVDQDR